MATDNDLGPRWQEKTIVPIRWHAVRRLLLYYYRKPFNRREPRLLTAWRRQQTRVAYAHLRVLANASTVPLMPVMYVPAMNAPTRPPITALPRRDDPLVCGNPACDCEHPLLSWFGSAFCCVVCQKDCRRAGQAGEAGLTAWRGSTGEAGIRTASSPPPALPGHTASNAPSCAADEFRSTVDAPTAPDQVPAGGRDGSGSVSLPRSPGQVPSGTEASHRSARTDQPRADRNPREDV